jgi:hypothetical protein
MLRLSMAALAETTATEQSGLYDFIRSDLRNIRIRAAVAAVVVSSSRIAERITVNAKTLELRDGGALVCAFLPPMLETALR